ncbi:uncharacterized protein V6R79_013975 [Siganus canaliculatus]
MNHPLTSYSFQDDGKQKENCFVSFPRCRHKSKRRATAAAAWQQSTSERRTQTRSVSSELPVLMCCFFIDDLKQLTTVLIKGWIIVEGLWIASRVSAVPYFVHHYAACN